MVPLGRTLVALGDHDAAHGAFGRPNAALQCSWVALGSFWATVVIFKLRGPSAVTRQRQIVANSGKELEILSTIPIRVFICFASSV